MCRCLRSSLDVIYEAAHSMFFGVPDALQKLTFTSRTVLRPDTKHMYTSRLACQVSLQALQLALGHLWRMQHASFRPHR